LRTDNIFPHEFIVCGEHVKVVVFMVQTVPTEIIWTERNDTSDYIRLERIYRNNQTTVGIHVVNA